MPDDYSPARIIRGLGSYRFLRMPLETPERLEAAHQARIESGTSLDDQLCEKCDLERALFDLPEVPFVVVCAMCMLHIQAADIAERLNLPQTIVGDLCMVGVNQMAYALGWQGHDKRYSESMIYPN